MRAEAQLHVPSLSCAEAFACAQRMYLQGLGV